MNANESNLDTACKVSSNVSQDKSEEPTSPATIDINYENQNIFYDDSQNQIKVVIRVRPFNEREEEEKKSCVSIDNGCIVLDRGADQKSFNFDFVGDEYIDQEAIFKQIAKPIADSCL